jgi:hypothetical protein
MNLPTSRSGSRVNASVVHGKFMCPVWAGTCLIRGVKREIPGRSIRLNNDEAYSVTVDRYECLWETQSQQQLMIFSIGPSQKRSVGAEH